MARSTGLSPDVASNMFKLKYACDLNFALMFDEFMAKCTREKKCDPVAIKGMKLEFINIVKALDSEEYKILPGDTHHVISFKLGKLKE